ncbi:MAG: hypothetical protein HY985_16460 [Magnetospirillum sp.]|nr:hypothetical protein [Magnetospirillum sp.]
MGKWMVGLDIGSDSIGWAAFEAEAAEGMPYPRSLRDGGVRLFDSGRDPKKQTSLHAERGSKRRLRRLPRVRRWRRARLRELLVAGGLAPPNRTVTDDLYRWRDKALRQPLPPDELWAVLMHIANHRGFLSTHIERRDAAKAGAVKPTKQGDDDKDAGFWIANERAVRERMEAVGAQTVGQLLYHEVSAGRPVRMRYGSGGTVPTRALLHEEVDAIRAVQAPHFPGVDWEAVSDCIFSQRPLRSAEGGVCEFFPDRDRCWRMMPSAQDFVVRQTLCNLRVSSGSFGEERPLTAEEWNTAFAMLSANARVEWPSLRKAIGLARKKFTVETVGGKRGARGTDGNQTEALLAPLVAGWSRLPLDMKDERFAAIVEARPDRRRLIGLLADPDGWFRLDAEQAEIAADGIQFVLPTGRLKISAHAARLICGKMVPGARSHEAIAAATGRDHSDRRPTAADKVPSLPYYGTLLRDAALGGTGNPKHSPERQFGRVANISVHIALNETAKIVNALIARYGGPPAMVVVETTRDLTAGAEERLKNIRDQAAREKQNDAIDRDIVESGATPLANKREQRLRWRLWKRQKHRCPYSGQIIGGADFLTAAYEIDHVIPLGLGGRDVFGNMVLCVAGTNRAKAKRLPCDAFRDDPEAQSCIAHFLAELDSGAFAALAWRFGDGARRRMDSQDGDDGDGGWAPRQIRDTSYVARLAMRYLAYVAGDVVATKGGLTAWLRSAWDLPKARWDHRSHFVDAAVIAVTNRSMVQRVNTMRAQGTLPQGHEADLPEPFEGFRLQVLRKWEALWPSYRPSHEAPTAGALHAENPLRLRPAEIDGAPAVALLQRRRVSDLFKDDKTAASSLENFASPAMRERFDKVLERKRSELPAAGLAELCRAAAADPHWGPRGMTGNAVLVEKPKSSLGGHVRIPRGNHRAVFATSGNHLYQVWALPGAKPKWEACIITRFAAAQGADATRPPQMGARLVMELRQGDLVYVPTVEDDKIFLVKKFAIDGRIHLWPARYAVSERDLPRIQELFPAIRLDKKDYWKIGSAEGLRKNGIRRATVSVLGRLRAKETSVSPASS